MESVTFCRRGGTVMDPDYTMNVMIPVSHDPCLSQPCHEDRSESITTWELSPWLTWTVL